MSKPRAVKPARLVSYWLTDTPVTLLTMSVTDCKPWSSMRCSVTTETDCGVSRSDSDNFRRAAEARLDLFPTRALTVSVGSELLWQRERNASRSPFGSSEFFESRRNQAYFAQAAGSTGGGAGVIDYTLGARLDQNQKFGDFGTYRAGAAYRTPGGTRVRAALGTAFREPSFIEVFNTAFARGNASLAPERSVSWEGALEQAVGAAVTLGATYFDQRFRDMIQYTGQPNGSTAPNYFNVARAAARGVELEARLSDWRGVFGAASYTALRTRVIDAGFQSGAAATFVVGERLLRRPTHSANLLVGYRLGRHGSVSAALDHTGDRSDRDFGSFPAKAVTLPAYTLLDLAADLPVAGSRAPLDLSLGLRLENATNHRIEQVFGYASAPRTLYLGLRARSR